EGRARAASGLSARGRLARADPGEGPMRRASVLLSLLAAASMACARGEDPDAALRARIRAAAEAIDDARLRAADTDVGNWLTHGRTYDERRTSPLDQIDEHNVSRPGLGLSLELRPDPRVHA